MLVCVMGCAQRTIGDAATDMPLDSPQLDSPRPDIRSDLFVFLDGHGRDAGAAQLTVKVETGGVDYLGHAPAMSGFSGNPSPLLCSVTVAIANTGTAHAAGVNLEQITIEPENGGPAQIIVPATSAAGFNGVVLAGAQVSPWFVCDNMPWSTPIPFECNDHVILRGVVVSFNAVPVAFASPPMLFGCPL